MQYHPGFGSEISSEALPHALPKGQVSGSHTADDVLMVFSSRTVPSNVPMDFMLNNSQGQLSPVPGRQIVEGIIISIDESSIVMMLLMLVGCIELFHLPSTSRLLPLIKET